MLDPCRNALEQGFYNYLAKNVASIQYESQTVPYVLPKKYVPDFTLTTKSGKTFHIEVKGYFRPEDVVKMRAVKFSNPDLDIRLLFAEDKPIRKGAKLTYMGWAKKNGFTAAVGKIPPSWLN